MLSSQTKSPDATILETKHVEEMQETISQNLNPMECLNTEPYIVQVIKEGNQEEFFKLLNLKRDPFVEKRIIDEVDIRHAGTALYWAAACGHVHFIAPLLKAGLKINRPDKEGKTPVFVAAQN